MNIATTCQTHKVEKDVVEVVRCKDCKHWHEWENGTGSCQRSENSCFWVGVDFDDYCSFGERKDGESE